MVLYVRVLILTNHIVIVVSACIDMTFWKWSLRPKHLKDEKLKRRKKHLWITLDGVCSCFILTASTFMMEYWGSRSRQKFGTYPRELMESHFHLKDYPEDAGNWFHRNVDTYLLNWIVSHGYPPKMSIPEDRDNRFLLIIDIYLPHPLHSGLS
jgi:hypothetical protein